VVGGRHAIADRSPFGCGGKFDLALFVISALAAFA
jgi:hypothetical protein